MQWLKRIFSSTRRITINNPLVIQAPRICFLNLMGPVAEKMLTEDKNSIGSLFTSIEYGNNHPSQCDVLMIYGNLDKDGRFTARSDSLRDIIRESNAPIVIIASENTSESYIAAGKKTGYGKANLIMTMDRKGSNFQIFFSHLFGMMFEGKSMLMAWVELAPQNPDETHANCPGTIFAAEVSHIIFKKA